MVEGHERDWKKLAEQAAAEKNPDKLLDLVKELNEVLDPQKVKSAKDEAGPIAAKPTAPEGLVIFRPRLPAGLHASSPGRESVRRKTFQTSPPLVRSVQLRSIAN
jgi:hypothetical protein